MRIEVHPSAEAATERLARLIAAVLEGAPQLVLGLPTGRTMVPVYARLREWHATGRADFSHVTTFNLDEFVGVAPGAPGSYRHFMDETLFRSVNIGDERIHFLDGTAPDLDAECRRYDEEIERAGRMAIQVLGLGANGHIGFNEPAAALLAGTHRVRLCAESRRANAALFGGDLERVPREALSMGIAAILRARAIVLLATGREKARATLRMICGPITTRLPASLLQIHGDTLVLLDEAAASQLPDACRARAAGGLAGPDARRAR